MSAEAKKAYAAKYEDYGKPIVGTLPTIDEDEQWSVNYFFWRHLASVRSAGKNIPLKLRRKLTIEEHITLQRELEHVVHHAKYALAFLDNIEYKSK